MKKVIIIITLILVLITGSAAGFLYNDWHKKTHIDDDEKYTYMYSWTDKQGQTHFSDKKPPTGAQDTRTIEALKPLETPHIVQIKESFSEFLYQSKRRIAAMFEPEQERAEKPGSNVKQVNVIKKPKSVEPKRIKKGKS
jgi:hypothetical protein